MSSSQVTGALSFAVCYAAEPLRSSSKMEGQNKKNKRGLLIGHRVQLHCDSLIGSSAPELNGVCGKIVKLQDPSTGRVGVQIENNGKVLALQPGHIARLCDCAGCCIQLHRPILRCGRCMNAA